MWQRVSGDDFSLAFKNLLNTFGIKIFKSVFFKPLMTFKNMLVMIQRWDQRGNCHERQRFKEVGINISVLIRTPLIYTQFII